MAALSREPRVELEKLVVTFEVVDPEVRAELERRAEGQERDRFAAEALRIGVLALRQASGAIDVASLRRQGDALFAQVHEALVSHGVEVTQTVSSTLARYLDPHNGFLPDRIDRLVRPGGELETLIGRQVGASDSQLARTLTAHIGAESPLLRALSPEEHSGILANLKFAIERALTEQRTQILREFSLDHSDSALSRLVFQLSASIEQVARDNGEFRQQLQSTLEAFRVRREVEARSTAHGHTFEDAAGSWLLGQAQRVGDVLEAVKDRPGAVPRCKVGDFVWVLGAETAAPDARIAIEVKDDRAYDIKHALQELAVARENRRASLGLFVFARGSAPNEIEPVARYGNDVVVIWDADDGATDTFLRAGLSILRALAVRASQAKEGTSASLADMERAVAEVLRHVGELEQIKTWGETVRSSGQKIVEKTELIRTRLERHMAALEESVQALKAGSGSFAPELRL